MKRKNKLFTIAFTLLLPGALIIVFNCCADMPRTATAQPASDTTTILPEENDLLIYNLSFFEQEKIAFVSLSEGYLLSDHPDSLAIPETFLENQHSKKFKDLGTVILEGIYRERLLRKTNTPETDTLFLYNYANDSLAAFPVSGLKTAARLSPYISEGDSIRQDDYMTGFDIADKHLNGFREHYCNSTLAYIGSENIFTRGQMRPVAWVKKTPDVLPVHSCANDLLSKAGYRKGNTYQYKNEHRHYFIQDVLFNGSIIARHLLVINDNNKKVLTDKIYSEGEGTSLAPLNFVNDEGGLPQQWTGKLFRNKPPVIFGFLYESFGCPAITFLDPSEHDIYLRCDNRH